jgi:Family of unknown function (DUF6134)
MLRSHSYAAVARRRFRCMRVAGPFLAVAVATSILNRGGALADTRSPEQIQRQTRTYSISIDGTRRGSSTAQFRSKTGAVWIRSSSEIRINYLVYKYNYASSGTEIWKNGRVTDFENTADYNGTQYVVKGTSTPRGLQVTTNGTASLVSADVWDTSYLVLPERLVRSDAAPVVLLDSDRGRLLSGKVQFIGEEALNIAEGQTSCTHYRIAGDVHVDLWFDASRRLLRADSQESGHKVRFELLSVTAE